jgi:uncharacterized protein (DUF1800 family)
MAASQRDLQAAIAVTRFGLGARPGEIRDVAADPQGWLKAQIRREGAHQPVGPIPLHSTAEGLAELMDDREKLRQAGAVDQAMRKQIMAPLKQEVFVEALARAQLGAGTPEGFRERWALFWANHFTVSAKNVQVGTAVGPFEREAIRPHVFGRFQDLLLASTRHPGMLLYLDQAQSLGPDSPAAARQGKGGLNENLAREIMELHTVGADAGYTQADVTEFARALTGWTMGGYKAVDGQRGVYFYRAAMHEPGVRTIMGRRYGGDGEDQARAILVDLANDERTSRRLAHKIAAHFVADDPPPALVQRLDGAWRRSAGDLSAVALALIAAPEAWAPQPRKFKTPYELVISSYRAVGAVPQDAAHDVGSPLNALGQRPYGAAQPNGWSDLAADWAAPDAIVKRLAWCHAFARSNAPQSDPVQVAKDALGARLAEPTRQAVARAETRPEALAILLMSPEFQRR